MVSGCACGTLYACAHNCKAARTSVIMRVLLQAHTTHALNQPLPHGTSTASTHLRLEQLLECDVDHAASNECLLDIHEGAQQHLGVVGGGK